MQCVSSTIVTVCALLQGGLGNTCSKIWETFASFSKKFHLAFFGYHLDCIWMQHPLTPNYCMYIAGLDTYSGAEELELCLLNAAEVVEELVGVSRGKPRLRFLGRSCRLSLSIGVAPRQRTVYIVCPTNTTQSYTHLTADHFLA